jgi:pimeloyl-ACP methyl ester carboxylesterase
MWEKLPTEVRQTFVFNAPTFLDEMNEPDRWMSLDLARLAAFSRPMLLSEGDQSPPFFAIVLGQIVAAVPHAQRYVYHGAGHVPHLTHADEFVGVVRGFVNAATV